VTEPSDPVRDHPDGATVCLRVIPRAPRTALAGRHGGAHKLKVAAPPVDGAANDEVRRFLAELSGVRRAEVAIISGERARDKVVLVRGVAPERLRTVLGPP
jgi:uncharacterized protein